MSETSLKKKNSINVRHAGVIGLCSFINAYPYTVPREVPPLFLEIGVHLNDPEPIPVCTESIVEILEIVEFLRV